jgi:hypothetical protein
LIVAYAFGWHSSFYSFYSSFYINHEILRLKSMLSVGCELPVYVVFQLLEGWGSYAA